ncbi:unnamed protein product [Caenorhabditis nigoni]
MSHLRSVQESKPQIYIFWQTMTAVIGKMIYTPHCLYYSADDPDVFIFVTRILDILSVPVIIQISYLTFVQPPIDYQSANQWNMDYSMNHATQYDYNRQMAPPPTNGYYGYKQF